METKMVMIMITLYTVEDRLQKQESNWKQVEVVASMEQNVFAPPLTNGTLYKADLCKEVSHEFYTQCNEFDIRYVIPIVGSSADKTTRN